MPSAAGVGVGVIGGTEAGATATSLGSLSFAPTSQTVATPGLLSATVGLQSQGQGSAVGGMLDYGRWKQVVHIVHGPCASVWGETVARCVVIRFCLSRYCKEWLH